MNCLSYSNHCRKTYSFEKKKYQNCWHNRWNIICNEECIAYLRKLRKNMNTTVYFHGTNDNANNSSKFVSLMDKSPRCWKLSYLKIGPGFLQKEWFVVDPHTSDKILNIHVSDAQELQIILPFIKFFKKINAYVCFNKDQCMPGMYCEYNQIRNIIERNTTHSFFVKEGENYVRMDRNIPCKIVHNI